MKYLMNKQERAALTAAKNDLTAARTLLEAVRLRAGNKQVVVSDDLRGGFLPYILKEAGVEIMPVILFSAATDAIRKESRQVQRPVLREVRAPGKTARKRASGAIARAEENRRYHAAVNSARAKSLGAGRKA